MSVGKKFISFEETMPYVSNDPCQEHFAFQKTIRDLNQPNFIGIDEAGRGAWAGPLVAAAVLVSDKYNFPYHEVTDSKLLSPQQREQLYPLILENAQVSFGLVSHRTIDERGLQTANVLAVDRALQYFSQVYKVKSDYIGKFHALSSTQHNVSLYVRGEQQFPEIAAASIMAKVFRDRLMTRADDMYKGYFFRRHKGYGTQEHKIILQKLGPCAIHRMSFNIYSHYR